VVISGDGALANLDQNPSGVTEIDDVIAQLVVHRGDEPLPPGERLAMRSPDMAADLAERPIQANSSGENKFANFQVRL
jgi:hypothetical protein